MCLGASQTVAMRRLLSEDPCHSGLCDCRLAVYDALGSRVWSTDSPDNGLRHPSDPSDNPPFKLEVAIDASSDGLYMAKLWDGRKGLLWYAPGPQMTASTS